MCFVCMRGVTLTESWKKKTAGYLKQLMGKKRFRYYFDPEVISGLATEQFEQKPRKAADGEGIIRFFHANGTHDDRFWSIVLALAASMEDTEPYVAVLTS